MDFIRAHDQMRNELPILSIDITTAEQPEAHEDRVHVPLEDFVPAPKLHWGWHRARRIITSNSDQTRHDPPVAGQKEGVCGVAQLPEVGLRLSKSLAPTKEIGVFPEAREGP